MRRTNPALIAMMLAALVMPGCAASPWAAKKPAARKRAAKPPTGAKA